MKTISVRNLQQKIKECVEAAQKDRVVVTRHGEPAALLIGLEGHDWEQVVLVTSESFWKMIEERRKQKTIPWAEVRRRLDAGRRVRPRRYRPRRLGRLRRRERLHKRKQVTS